MKTPLFRVCTASGVFGFVFACVFLGSVASVHASGENCNAWGGVCKLVGGPTPSDLVSCGDLLPGSTDAGMWDCNQSGYEMHCCKGGPTDANAPVVSPKAPSTKLSTAANYGYVDPMGGLTIPGIVARIISNILPVIGALFLVFFIWGGAQYLTAGGDDTKVKKARQTLVNAAIGMMIVMGAYAIVWNIIKIFGTAITSAPIK